MHKKIIMTILITIVVILSGLAAYRLTALQDTAEDGKISIAATFYPLYEFAVHVGGDRIAATNLTPPGIEPHDFEPSPKTIIKAQESDILIYNGGTMEPWVNNFLKDYSSVAIKASNGLSLQDADHGHSHNHESEVGVIQSGNDVVDPHFWLDPVAAQQIVINIRDGLTEVDPMNKEYYFDNATRYNKQLTELDQSFTDRLTDCRLDTVISSHAALSYLAERYDFHVESIAGIEPSDEPTPAKMAEITNLVRQKDIKYIFFENLVSPRLSQTIAREAGAETLVFDPIESLTQEDQDKGKDYIGVQYENIANLETALECR